MLLLQNHSTSMNLDTYTIFYMYFLVSFGRRAIERFIRFCRRIVFIFDFIALKLLSLKQIRYSFVASWLGYKRNFLFLFLCFLSEEISYKIYTYFLLWKLITWIIKHHSFKSTLRALVPIAS